MKGLEEIIEENKKADADKTEVKIELSNQLTVKRGNTRGVIVITQEDKTIPLTQTVLEIMLAKHNPNGQNEWDINDIILHFLQNL